MIKLLHGREICYLGFGDIVQLSTQINDIEGGAGTCVIENSNTSKEGPLVILYEAVVSGPRI
jgi:hypothetical protein